MCLCALETLTTAKSWNSLIYKVFLKTLSYEEKNAAIASPGSWSLIPTIRGSFGINIFI